MDRGELQTAFNDWLAVREAEGIRPATIKTYKDHLRIFMLGMNGQELGPQTFAAFFREYAEEHSPASCKTIYTSMKSFLRGIGRVDLIGNMKRPRGDTPPKQVYSHGQLETLWALLRADNSATGARDHAMISVLFHTGLRVSELCALQLDDLSAGLDMVTVRGGKSRYAARDVPLLESCARTLSHYLGRARPRFLHHASEHVFLTLAGEPMNRSSVRMMLRRRGQQVGFPLSAHRFRHTWVTVHVRARSSPPLISRMAGWSPKTATEMLTRYAHPSVSDLREAQEEAFSETFGAEPFSR